MLCTHAHTCTHLPEQSKRNYKCPIFPRRAKSDTICRDWNWELSLPSNNICCGFDWYSNLQAMSNAVLSSALRLLQGGLLFDVPNLQEHKLSLRLLSSQLNNCETMRQHKQKH